MTKLELIEALRDFGKPCTASELASSLGERTSEISVQLKEMVADGVIQKRSLINAETRYMPW